MSKKILLGLEARKAIEKGVDQLVDAVKITLGPKGKNVVLERGNSTPLITNDGVTIAKEITLPNPFENLGANIIKEVCIKTNDVAGDGTTTASVLAQALMKEGLKLFSAGANPILLREGINGAISVAVNKLKSLSLPINTSKEIEQVATISAGNSEVGKLISESMEKVGKDGVITIEEGSTTKTELNLVEGMQIDKGYISSYMCNDTAKMQSTLSDAYILITSKKLSSLQDILPLLEQISSEGKSLLIIADDIEGDALTTLVVNKVRGTLNSVAISSPSFGDRRKEELIDLATFVGTKVFGDEFNSPIKDVTLQDLGKAKQIIVSKDKTTILQGAGCKDEILDRISFIKSQLDMADNTYDKEVLTNRIGRLKGRVAIIKVGALTELELKEKKLRIEDALNATKAGVEEGIIPGGGTSFLNCIEEVKNYASTLTGDYKLGAEIVANALSAPIRQICENANIDAGVVINNILNAKSTNYGFNALTNEYCNMIDCGIVDPTKVSRSALENAGSVVSTMLTTECLIVENYPKENRDS